jgi:hypothetical protein
MKSIKNTNLSFTFNQDNYTQSNKNLINESKNHSNSSNNIDPDWGFSHLAA